MVPAFYISIRRIPFVPAFLLGSGDNKCLFAFRLFFLPEESLGMYTHNINVYTHVSIYIMPICPYKHTYIVCMNIWTDWHNVDIGVDVISGVVSGSALTSWCGYCFCQNF